MKRAGEEIVVSSADILDMARQGAIKSLINSYRKLPANAIKVYLACVDEAGLVESAGRMALSQRPSIRKLAIKCEISKATVQTALNALTNAGLLKDNRPLLSLDNSSGCYFHPTDSGQQAQPVEQQTGAAQKRAPISIIADAVREKEVDNMETALATTTAPPPPATLPATPAGQAPREVPVLPLDKAADDHLISYYQQGNQEAFAELYKRYYDVVRQQIGRSISPAAAYDFAQQIFIELMEKLKTFNVDGEAKFSTWLYRFTELTTANARRKEKREQQFSAISEDFDIKTIIRLTSPQQQIMPYLLTLDKKQQECVYLHYYEGLTYEDISVRLELDEAIVRTYLQTARRHIRSFIEQQAEQKKEQESWLYNKFFLAALEKEKDHADTSRIGFSFCLFSARLMDKHSADGYRNEIITSLGKIIVNSIQNPSDQAFLLGEERFALILSSCTGNSARVIARRIEGALRNSLSRPIMLSCLIVEYSAAMPLKTFLMMAHMKFIEVEARGDITLMISTNPRAKD